MKKITLIIASAVLGMVVILALNISEVASFGHGIEIPVGWQEPLAQEDMFCTLQARYNEGLPFATERPAGCDTAHNALASAMNLAIGAVLGAGVGLAVTKRTHKG